MKAGPVTMDQNMYRVSRPINLQCVSLSQTGLSFKSKNMALIAIDDRWFLWLIHRQIHGLQFYKVYANLSPTNDESRPLIGQLAMVYDLACQGKYCMPG